MYCSGNSVWFLYMRGKNGGVKDNDYTVEIGHNSDTKYI